MVQHDTYAAKDSDLKRAHFAAYRGIVESMVNMQGGIQIDFQAEYIKLRSNITRAWNAALSAAPSLVFGPAGDLEN